MTTEARNSAIAGGVIGFLLWLFDYRYALLGGLPDTPVSDAIRGFLPIDPLCALGWVEGANVVCGALGVLLALVAAGIVLGFLVSRLMRLLQR